MTDTGEVAETLDLAARRWPEAGDRKELLVRLVAAGRAQVARELAEQDGGAQRERQRRMLERFTTLVDAAELESDAAWR